MKLVLLLLVVFTVGVRCQQHDDQCGEPGPEWRDCGGSFQPLFHFNEETESCVVFTSSCENPPKTFKTLRECAERCVEQNRRQCVDALKDVTCDPNWADFGNEDPCPTGFLCKPGVPTGSCCPKDRDEWIKEALSSTCPQNRVAAFIDQGSFRFPYISHTCLEMECPSGFECMEINPLFVKCCENLDETLRLGATFPPRPPCPEMNLPEVPIGCSLEYGVDDVGCATVHLVCESHDDNMVGKTECSDPDKEFKECGTHCPTSCGNRNKILPCNRACNRGCFCKPPMILEVDDMNSACVLPEECEEEVTDTSEAPETVEVYPSSTPSPDEYDESSTDFPDDYPIGTGAQECDDPDKEWKDCGGAKCVATCADPFGLGPCIETCEPGCHCIGSMVRSSNDPMSKCVLPTNCPPSLYSDITRGPFPAVDGKCPEHAEFNVLALGCPITCERTEIPAVCGQFDYPGCVCIQPYILNSDKGLNLPKCILPEECPKKPTECPDPNRYFEPSAPYCPEVCNENPMTKLNCEIGSKPACLCKYPLLPASDAPDAPCVPRYQCNNTVSTLTPLQTTPRPYTNGPVGTTKRQEGPQIRGNKPFAFELSNAPKPARPTPLTTCRDEDERCPLWGQAGICQSNSGWMMLHCQKTCDCCGCTFGDLFNSKFPNKCANRNSALLCSIWAKTGQCEENWEYMEIYCREACNVCSMQK